MLAGNVTGFGFLLVFELMYSTLCITVHSAVHITVCSTVHTTVYSTVFKIQYSTDIVHYTVLCTCLADAVYEHGVAATWYPKLGKYVVTSHVIESVIVIISKI